MQIRRFVKRDLTKFIQAVGPLLAPQAFNFALITDTHDKARPATSYYGPNGYWHVVEQHWLSDRLPLAFRVHLGDLVDGSEAPWITRWRLRNLIRDYAQSELPFLVAKGNHDDNDKYAERQHRHTGAFSPDVIQRLVFQPLAQQTAVTHVSENGLTIVDRNDLRTIMLNTSDVPSIDGQRHYDVKKTLAISIEQLRQLVTALVGAGDRDVLLLAHAPAIRPNGKPGLKFNSMTLHEILWAFTQHAKGKVTSHAPGPFGGEVSFDFSQQKGTIIAYLAGHWHIEADYRVNGIHYSLQNTAALMGKRHGLTTRYNRHFDRRIDHPSEYAGYVVSVDSAKRELAIFGYGASSRVRRFNY